MPNDPLIQLEHISFSYHTEKVLDDISLSVNAGDFLGLVGPNGSGKTTLLKLILGLIPNQSGDISLFGVPQKSFSEWKKIGYVPQRAGVSIAAAQYPLTVTEVVEMGHASKSAARTALGLVGMQQHGRRLVKELSGGQQQRVFIARALATRPQLLILDEPTAGVDADSQSQFYELLKKFNQEHGLTLILVSHDIDVVAHEVKTVACINKTLVFHGPPREFFHKDIFEKLYGANVRYVVHGH